ncbi:MAG: hypothetical protein ACLPQS_02115 [Acidimicrobiales bacterium]
MTSTGTQLLEELVGRPLVPLPAHPEDTPWPEPASGPDESAWPVMIRAFAEVIEG